MTVWATATWRWFRARVTLLLATDTPLARHFTPVKGDAGV